ncbi:MAG: glycosyltransferase [Gemmatimonadota bacterium]
MTIYPRRERNASARRRLRVLHIVLNLHQGGLERVIGDLLRGLDPDAFELHVLALRFLGQLSHGLDDYATLHVAKQYSRWSMLHPSGIRDEIAEIAPDIVHTHSGVWFKASLAARMAGVPFLVHSDHGRQSPDPWADRFVDGLASRRTDVVIAVSEPLGRQLATTVVAHPERVRVIHNGVDTDTFCQRPDDGVLRAELGIGPSVPIIGSIGRLDRIKGFDVMIDAFAVLRAQWPGTDAPVLVIGGDGPERDALRNQVQRLGLDGQTHLLGWRSDVGSMLRAFSLFTMSSHSEGTSIGLLEAMSSGRCPVVTDVGGNADVLGAALRHRLRPVDAAQIAHGWMDALRDPTRLLEDGNAARQRVVEKFSLAAMIAAHESLYRSAMPGTP